MGKKTGILLLVLLLAVTAQAQTRGMIFWAADQPLQWNYFRGKPDAPEKIYAAATYAGLELDVVDVSFSGRMTFKVRAVFDGNRSWAHPDRTDDAVLAHEQLHFDIAEAYARKLERKLNSLQLKTGNRDVAKKLLIKYNNAQLQEQKRYDQECMHGLQQEKQLEWQEKVEKELNIKRASASARRQ